jgi:hypothetical protein
VAVDPLRFDRARSSADDTVAAVDARRKIAHACAAVVCACSFCEGEVVVSLEGIAWCEDVGNWGGSGEDLGGCKGEGKEEPVLGATPILTHL